MTNSSSVKTPILLTSIAVVTIVGLVGPLSGGGMVQAQSIAATEATPSTPLTPKEELEVGQVFTFNADSLPPNNIEQCIQYAKELVGKAIPDHNLCDLVVYRQAPVVARSDGMIMNNYSGMGHYIELIPAPQYLNNSQEFQGMANASTNGNTTSTTGASNNDGAVTRS
jgi:hypothetical protein